MDDVMRCRGMRDMLPRDMACFRLIEQAFREVCAGWGFEEVRTPTIEHLHLFTSAGTLSPQMLDRVYSFLDWDGWSGERVVLRPDSTIPVARLYSEQVDDRRTARLFYVQNVFRFAQGDESREDWQCGVELIGDTQPAGDVELILVASEVLAALGISAELKLSDPGILRAILVKAGFSLGEQLELYDRVLDGETPVLGQVQERIPGIGVSLGVLLSEEGGGAEHVNNLRSLLLPAVAELARPLDELAAVSEVLAGIGMEHRIAPLLVRNFEYYTGPVFHFYAGGEKAGGGGRYDALLEQVGGKSVPASGFALDMNVLAPMVRLDGPAAEEPGSILVHGGLAELVQAFALARDLRSAGRRFVIGPGGEDTSAQVTVTEGGFSVVRKGRGPQQLGSAAEAARALAADAP